MTNDEIIDRLLYLKLSEELNLGLIQDRIDLLEEYPSIIFHPCQLYGVRDFFKVIPWENNALGENTKYGNISTATFTHAIWYDFPDGKSKITKLKLDYSPNFNKITKRILKGNFFIESEKYGLCSEGLDRNKFCFLNKDDAVRFQQRNNKEIKND